MDDDDINIPGLGGPTEGGAGEDPGQELLDTIRRLQRQVTAMAEQVERNA